jgi:hypothetical protein
MANRLYCFAESAAPHDDNYLRIEEQSSYTYIIKMFGNEEVEGTVFK